MWKKVWHLHCKRTSLLLSTVLKKATTDAATWNLFPREEEAAFYGLWQCLEVVKNIICLQFNIIFYFYDCLKMFFFRGEFRDEVDIVACFVVTLCYSSCKLRNKQPAQQLYWWHFANWALHSVLNAVVVSTACIPAQMWIEFGDFYTRATLALEGGSQTWY